MNSLFQTADTPMTSGFWRGDSPIGLFWQQRRVFAIVFVVVLAIAIAALLLLPHRYFASGSIIVAEPESGLALPPAGWAQKVGDPADIESQLVVIKSTRVMRLVLDAPGVIDAIRKECNARNPIIALFSLMSCDDLTADSTTSIDYLLNNYTVGGAGRSRVITIGYTSSQPQVAQTMANALVNTFLQDHREGLSDARTVAMRGLTEEINRLDREIASDDQKIQVFRAERGLTNGATAPITSERLSSINTQLSIAERSRSEAAAIIAAARDGGTSAAATLPAVLESRSVADVKQRLAAAEQQAAAAAIALGPRHPTLRAMQSQVTALQASLDREVENTVESAHKQFDAAERTVASLTQDLEAAKNEASSAIQDETSIEQMVRDLGVKRNQYTTLLGQRKGLESEQKALLGSTRLVSLAELPDRKYFPKTAPFVAGGLALALVLGSGAAVMWGRFAPELAARRQKGGGADRSIVIARLPRIRPRRSQTSGMLDTLIEADDDPAMRSALSAILSSLDGARAVVVLSAFAGEGKTFTTMALARFAAEAGRHVLIVEADTQRSRFADLLGTEHRAGFAEILAGTATPASTVVQTDVDGLDAITAGDASAYRADGLMGKPIEHFLTWTSSYDLVLIDGPALDQQMDAGLLACRVEGFLFCVGAGEEQLPQMEPISRRLTKLGARSFGFVLTPPSNAVHRSTFGLLERMRSMVGGH